jgi:hypothetical protein
VGGTPLAIRTPCRPRFITGTPKTEAGRHSEADMPNWRSPKRIKQPRNANLSVALPLTRPMIAVSVQGTALSAAGGPQTVIMKALAYVDQDK